MDDDWGDIDDEPRMPRRAAPPTGQSAGLSRQQRFINTLAVVSALMLVLGVGLGFALGRATAPTVPAQPAEVATLTVESTASADSTASAEPTVVVEATPTPEPTAAPPPKNNQPPKTPTQLDPDDGARIDASRVTIRWSKVTDPSGGTITYAFQIQTYSGGEWVGLQTIGGLKTRSYSVRVLANRRRWRVWATDDDGNTSGKSDWSYFRHTPSTTTSSTETSSH